MPGRCLGVREGEHLSGPVPSIGDIVGTKQKTCSQGANVPVGVKYIWGLSLTGSAGDGVPG